MFFFFTQTEFRKGDRCKIIRNDSRHITMPKIFPDLVGQIIVIVSLNGPEWVWAYEDRPIRYKTNGQGREVVEFDPRCVNSLYEIDRLQLIDKNILRDNQSSRYGYLLEN